MTETIGFRFDRRDAKTLERMAYELNAVGVDRNHVALFDNAAKAAAKDEPLHVFYEERAEVEQLASAFVLYGVARPAIEDVRTPQGGNP